MIGKKPFVNKIQLTLQLKRNKQGLSAFYTRFNIETNQKQKKNIL